MRDEFIGPTIGAELRRNATIALGLALAAQLTYLAVRFRWTYGIAAVVTLFRDTVVLIGSSPGSERTSTGCSSPRCSP